VFGIVPAFGVASITDYLFSETAAIKKQSMLLLFRPPTAGRGPARCSEELRSLSLTFDTCLIRSLSYAFCCISAGC
jgi:hypothetical protein